jgi:acetylglutamate kinase
MRVLIKLGGTLLDNAESRERLAGEIAAAMKPGVDITVVHGGGKQMTRFLEERGVASEFFDGLRVTTPSVLDAVLKVFAGSVNHQLVASFVRAGAAAIGLTGIDAALVEAEQLDPRLGAVGKPVRANAQVLQVLNASGYLPVVACVAGDRAGNIYNVNADQMASGVAAAWRADAVLFLTDVDGVKGADGKVIAHLTPAAAEELMQSGVANGGMLAKLRAAAEALRNSAGAVHIVNGAKPGIVARLLAGEAEGTRFA